MADLIKGDTEEPQGDVSSDPVDPFGGDSVRLTWAREVAVGQLQQEIVQVLPDVRLAAAFPLDKETGEPVGVSAQSPLVLYVTPSSADVAAVRQVLGAHRPDPYFGMSEEEKSQAQLKEKIAAGLDLSPQEMQTALQMLVAGIG
ncbi:hypothetical protein [Streptomyces griseoaurantiacus]|uniref:hypothetical protein n=1 Tax=Streptomyces griseoaurantiacus TaxID=68213 RepID=UPI003681BEB9